jgi:hypothetical protein
MTNEAFGSDYFSYFPTFGLAYKMGDMFQIAFNAARKINRPQMEMINPFVKVNGPNSITRGNPRLEPTYTNSYELRFNPLLNIFFNDSKGRPASIATNVDDSVTVTTTINSVSNKSYGFELTIPVINEPRFPVKLPDWFSMFTMRISYTKTIEEGGYLKEGYSINRNAWRFNGNFSVKLWEDINAMMYYNYALPAEDARYKSGAVRFMGIVLSRDFFEKKLSLSLNFNDVFNSMQFVNETHGSNFYSYSKTQVYKNQSVGLNIRYNFNDFTNRKEKTIDDGRDKESGLFGDR